MVLEPELAVGSPDARPAQDDYMAVPTMLSYLLPPDILTKELLPFFDAASLLRLSGCSKKCRSTLRADLAGATTNPDIDALWRALHQKRWRSSSRLPPEGKWYAEYKRRHLLDATVRSRLRSPSHGSRASEDPAWRHLLLQGGPDIVDRLYQFVKEDSGLEATSFERQVAETALVAINRMDVVKKWKRLMLDVGGAFGDDAQRARAEQNVASIEDGAILIARFYVDRGRVRADMDALETVERRINRDLDRQAHRLSLRLLSRFRNMDKLEARRMYGFPILGIPGNEYPLAAILEEMKYIFRGDDEDNPTGYAGNQDDYYNYENSLLDRVLMKSKGIPITLSILYAAIVRRSTGLIIDPVGLPGHFILGTQPDQDGNQYFIDAFRGGEILNLDQTKNIVASFGYPWNDGLILAVPYREVWLRVLRNLQNAHSRHQDAHPMAQLAHLSISNPANIPPALRAIAAQEMLQHLGGGDDVLFHYRMFECLRLLHPLSLQTIRHSEEQLIHYQAFGRSMCG